MSVILVWSIVAAAIAGILFRPKNWPEAVWPCLGAFLLVTFRLLPLSQAFHAVAKGMDVYLFLTGMMLLSELAGREGVFDWLATKAVSAAKGSRARLFALVYAVGIVVTVFLSNDATAVVLTPAVYAAVKTARIDALPYLLICAFIANAASFVLPISNPANLVVYGSDIPPLAPWLRTFLVPSICSISVTWVALRWLTRTDLRKHVKGNPEPLALTRGGRRAAWGTVAAGAVMIGASAFGADPGLPACLAAIAAVLAAAQLQQRAVREVAAAVSWSVLPLVAGLFVLVEALDRAGALADAVRLLKALSSAPRLPGDLAASFGVAALSNAINNLPSGLLARNALKTVHVTRHIRDALLIGVDLGPNLSVTGSLATVLWLMALRREGEQIDAWTFLKAGALIMPPALLAATLSLSLMSR